MDNKKNTEIRISNQHGDVLLRPITHLPKTAKVVPAENGRLVLAKGESTGHAHTLLDMPGVRLYTLDELTEEMRSWECGTPAVLEVTQPIPRNLLTHEEHGPQMIEPGLYHIGAVREFDYLASEARKVRD